MSLLQLELRQNPITGRHDLVVKLESDADLTTHEHELLHKKILTQLIGPGVLDPSQLGNCIVERVSVLTPKPVGQNPSNPLSSKQAEFQE